MLGTFMFVTFPDFVSNMLTVRTNRGSDVRNQMCSVMSICESCRPRELFSADGVPSDQSVPSLVGKPSFVASGSASTTGMLYSVTTALAASPVGRGRSLTCIGDGPGPGLSARYDTNSFMS